MKNLGAHDVSRAARFCRPHVIWLLLMSLFAVMSNYRVHTTQCSKSAGQSVGDRTGQNTSQTLLVVPFRPPATELRTFSTTSYGVHRERTFTYSRFYAGADGCGAIIQLCRQTSHVLQWFKCRIRGGGMVDLGLGPCPWSRAFS